MTFTYDSTTGTWKAPYTFKTPGNYILRTVMLDGVNYDLNTPPKVTIEGFTIVSLDWEPGMQTASFMTANTYVSTNLSLSFASNDEKKMPKKVEGRFIRDEDGSVNNVVFTYEQGLWRGTVTFSSSGNYRLEFLKLDGQIVEIPNGVGTVSDLRKYAIVYLGMKVMVTTDSPREFLYELKELEEEPLKKNLFMKVKIMDDTDNVLPGLTGVNLYYKSQSSAALENGMHCELTWNGNSGYYEGSFRTKIGIYQFFKVDVDVTSGDTTVTNTITRATDYPTFTIKSVSPPSLVRNDSVAWQFVPKVDADNFAKFTIKLDKEAAALNGMTAVMVKKGINGAADVEYIVTGEENFTPAVDDSGNYNWSIKIPIDEETGNQEGVWQLLELRIPNVGEYTVENPLVFTFPDDQGKVTEDVIVTVVAQPEVKLSSDDVIELSKTNNDFLEAKTIAAKTFSVIIKDFAGNGLDSKCLDSTVTLHYTYNNDSEAYGGYTFSQNQYPEDGFDITLTRQPDGKTFTQESGVSVPYAGTYNLTSVTYKINNVSYVMKNGGDYALPTGAPIIKLWSTAPSVEVSGVTPTTAVETQSSGTKTASYDKYSATVYFAFKNGGCSANEYTQPTVTIDIFNMGKAQSATLSFGSDKYVYNDGTQTGSFVWSQGQSKSTRGIGSLGKNSSTRTQAGTITADTLTLSNANGTFTVKLSNPITINNPD